MQKQLAYPPNFLPIQFLIIFNTLALNIFYKFTNRKTKYFTNHFKHQR